MLDKYFFEEEIEETADSILRYSDGPCLILNVLTDTHYNPYDADNARRTMDTFQNLQELNRRVYTHGIVHMGDVTIHGTEKDGVPTVHGKIPFTREVSSRLISQVRGWMLQANSSVFMVNGNHDGAGGSVPMTSNYNCMATQNSNLTVREGDNPYYYVDFDFVNVRALFLSTNTTEDIHVWGVSDTQLAWIKKTLLEAPDDYSVLVFSHIGTYDIESFLTNREDTTELFNQFHRHTGEFKNKTGRCIAWCCGHWHFDWVVPASFSGLVFPMIEITSSLMHGFIPEEHLGYKGYINPPRMDKTKDQDAWDTLIYRSDTKMLYLVRFGGGADRVINLSNWVNEV